MYSPYKGEPYLLTYTVLTQNTYVHAHTHRHTHTHNSVYHTGSTTQAVGHGNPSNHKLAMVHRSYAHSDCCIHLFVNMYIVQEV